MATTGAGTVSDRWTVMPSIGPAVMVAGSGIFAGLATILRPPATDPPASMSAIPVAGMTGSLAGASVPPLRGWLRQTTGSFTPPTLLLVGIAVICAGLTMAARHMAARGSR